MSVQIRPARQDDIPAMTALLSELFAIEADFQPAPARQRQGLQLLLENPERRVALVAERHGQVIGMVTLQTLVSTAEGGEAGLVEDMIVTRAHRGKGVGKLLLTGVTRLARARGLTRLQLLADKNNAGALGFYQSQNWQATQLTALRRLPKEEPALPPPPDYQ